MPEQLSFQLVPPTPVLKQLWTPDDIYDRLDDDLIKTFVEDRRVERKGANVKPDVLGDCLSMWANT